MNEKNETTGERIKFFKMVLAFFCIIAGLTCIIFILDLLTPDIAKAKPLDDNPNTATLYIQNGLELKSLNGHQIKVRAARFMAKAIAVNVPAGFNTLVFDYDDDDSTAKNIELKIDFESGDYYFVNYKEYREEKKNMISVYLRPTEEGVYRDPEVKQHWYNIFFYHVLKAAKIMGG